MPGNLDLQQKFFECNVYDAWQYFQNACFNIGTAKFIQNTIDSLLAKNLAEQQEFQMSIENKLFSPSKAGKISIVTVRNKDFPRFSVDVAGQKVGSVFLINKLLKDYFQYARNSFDSIAQVINASLLAFYAKDIEQVDIGWLFREVEKGKKLNGFPQICEWLRKMKMSEEYEYIDSYCNMTKHICAIDIKVSIPLWGTGFNAVINSFEKRNKSFPSQSLEKSIPKIQAFLEDSFNEFTRIINAEVETKVNVINRNYCIKAYQRIMKDDPENNYAVFYIEGKAESMPENIEILFTRKMKDGYIVAQNCEIDTIYIKDYDSTADKTEYAGRYVAIKPIASTHFLFYRRYKKEMLRDNTEATYREQIIKATQDKGIILHINPYIEFEILSDDDRAMQRAQSGF